MRKRSVFFKLFLIFLGTMVVTAVVLGFVGSLLYKNFFFQERTDAMTEQGRTIASLIADSTWKPADLQRLLKLSATSRTWIFVYGDDMQLKASAPKTAAPPDAGVELEIVKQALGGTEQRQQLTSLDSQPSEAVEIAIPIRHGSQVNGVVVMQALGFERHFGGVYQLLLIAGVTAVLLTSVIAFFFSRSIARPVQEMSMIARRMAKGDFSRKAKVRSLDEVGELALAFNHMADELSKLESMRREFVAHASHELRSPLTSIRGFVQAMLDGTIPPDDARPFLERIHKESQRLGNLVDELLTLSSLENDNGEEADKTRSSLAFAVNEAVETLQPLMQEKNIYLQCSIEEVQVRGDVERIVQIVINLLSNAIRFSHEQGRIEINVKSVAGQGRVDVIDHGIGIPEEDVERVFERFYKVDKARTSIGGGTGLGLSIAKRITEMYGGQIGIQSKWGQGTTAWFALPLAAEETIYK
jgi:signal transduction histidine kinase